jgi:2-amino-4-hydroxy-6-hydroxymethyldihydropteridine diphosphokinase
VAEVFVAAGSNLQPRRQLRRALALLRARWPGLRVSRAFASRASGFEGADFINLVVGFEADEPLPLVIAGLRQVEDACGRERGSPGAASRVSLDLDLLLYGDLAGEYDGRQLPRPELVTRPYMLGPLADLAPELRHPVLQSTIGELWAKFEDADSMLTPVSLEDGG